MPRITAYRNFAASSTHANTSTTFTTDDPNDNLESEDDSCTTSYLGGVDAESFELMLPSHPICIARGFADS